MAFRRRRRSRSRGRRGYGRKFKRRTRLFRRAGQRM